MPDQELLSRAQELKMKLTRDNMVRGLQIREQIENEVNQAVQQRNAFAEKLKAYDKPLEEPWIDPVSAAAGGFGGSMMANIGKSTLLKTLARATASGATGAIADYPIGMATEKVGEKYPKLALPFNVMAGMGSGMTLERLAEDAIMNPKVFKNVLANQTGAIKLGKKTDDFVYHGTGEGAFRKIREMGLVPQGSGKNSKYIYFADENYAETYASRKDSPFGNRVLRVRKTDDIIEDTGTSGGDFKTTQPIQPEDIEVKVGDKWVKLMDYSDKSIGILPKPSSPPEAKK